MVEKGLINLKDGINAIIKKLFTAQGAQ